MNLKAVKTLRSYPYHTSVDVCTRTCKRPTKSHQRLCYNVLSGQIWGRNCLLILSSADKGTGSKSQGLHDVNGKDQSRRYQEATCCCCFKSWVACGGLDTRKRTSHLKLHAQIQKVLSEVSNFDNVFF